MANPQFHEEKHLSLLEVKNLLEMVQKRDKELNFRSTKAKEYLDVCPLAVNVEREQLRKKLLELNLTRLKEEHISKIIDFMPVTVNDLKVVLQAYPLTMQKKDQESIVAVIKEFKG